MMKIKIAIGCLMFLAHASISQSNWDRKFEQLGTELPTPNSYRTASGAPGKDYWQQRADYKMSVELDDENQKLSGKERITYFNNSPDELRYLWLQLDQNMRSKESNTPLVTTTTMSNKVSGRQLVDMIDDWDYLGGFNITKVAQTNGADLKHTINQTMMRVDLPEPLGSGEQFSFDVEWWYNINDRMKDGGRSGYEYFPADGNYVYTIAQFFPRMAVYDDLEGWQHKQFLGRGEFALVFGNYEMDITVPSDHILGGTGDLQNPEEVLSDNALSKFQEAQNTYDKPVIIVSEKEARKKEKSKAKSKSTWKFKAENVRDVAFATSRKFIWDAMAVKVGDKTPLAMSYYPKEGNPLWEKESTIAVANTLKTYSKHTIDYPYPVAISVHAASIGMEYPMICFNFGRPNADGTYSDATKWRMIGVIIHEVGHNFFPMIINSDERQWTWMDEGLNSFVQSLCQREYYPDSPLRRGTATSMIDYMKGDKNLQRPIMTNSEQILQFGNNAYGKPAAALWILRETIMGPELFDYAFKEYSRRWAFKHPSPGDFFRTMEDASAVDLDWFWKGWFYTTDHVDMSIDNVKWYKMAINEEGVENQVTGEIANPESGELPGNFQEAADTFEFTDTDNSEYREFMNRLDDNQIKQKNASKNFYEITFKNKGGLVMPVIVEWTFTDGTKEVQKIPAEIWRRNEQEVTKVFAKDKEVMNIVLDPDQQTSDTYVDDNIFPRVELPSRFQKFKDDRD
ncbi:MAG: M1 family metallopeptidase [Cyclobacteriaceae bacterium]